MKSAPAIAFDYRASRSLLAATAVVAALGIMAIAASGLAPWLKIAAALSAGIYAARELYRLMRPVVQRCAWHESGHWRVRDAEGEEHIATLRHMTVRGPLIVIVLLAGPLRRVCLVLLPDNSDVDVRRRLRLRQARSEASAGAA